MANERCRFLPFCRQIEAPVTGGYATSAERLRQFRELVRPWQDRTSVKELDECLALV
jgi:hypothetical protein